MSRRRASGLRARFLVASVLLVLSTVVASAWTLFALGRLGGIADSMVEDSDETTAATTALASALEREDDAFLLVLSDPEQSQVALARTRIDTDRAREALAARLVRDGEQAISRALVLQIRAYRDATDALVRSDDQQPLERYHAEINPLLRAAVGSITSIRDQHFQQMREGIGRARREVARTRTIALLVSAVALLVSVLVALRLARDIIGPLGELERGVAAVREGDFDARIALESPRELQTVASTFNEMAERLAAFRRSNLAEVLRAKATLEGILRALPDAIVLLDADGTIAAMNPAAERLFREGGRERPEHARDLESVGIREDDLRARSLDAGALGLDLADALAMPQGQEVRRILPRIVPIEEGEERDGSVVVALYDVTDLARLDEMRAELVAVASHELRTPVTTMRMTLLLLREMSERLDPRSRELVDTALFGVEQLGETVGQLLDLTHLEAGRIELERELLDLRSVVREAERRWRAAIEDAGAKLVIALPNGRVPLVHVDRGRLRIVLDNLMGNALKYTPPGGEIQLVLEVTDGQVRCCVLDDGPGVPEEYRERIFEKFFRVEHVRARTDGITPRGSGMGLYLCKQLVELHGGTIWWEAAVPLAGSCFVFTLPAHRPMMSSVASSAGAPSTGVEPVAGRARPGKTPQT